MRVTGVVMVTGSQYVACMQLAASRKRTAHTGGHGNTPPCGSTSCLRLWLELPPVLTSSTLLPNQLCLWVQFPLLQCCFWVQVCNYLRVHESHLPDQEGGVTLFIVACDCEIPIVGDTVWIGPVLVTLDLQTNKLFFLQFNAMLDNHKYIHAI